ncbi:MAG: Ig-like domain-containing protein, partial [Thermoproteota archaeon]
MRRRRIAIVLVAISVFLSLGLVLTVQNPPESLPEPKPYNWSENLSWSGQGGTSFTHANPTGPDSTALNYTHTFSFSNLRVRTQFARDAEMDQGTWSTWRVSDDGSGDDGVTYESGQYHFYFTDNAFGSNDRNEEAGISQTAPINYPIYDSQVYVECYYRFYVHNSDYVHIKVFIVVGTQNWTAQDYSGGNTDQYLTKTNTFTGISSSGISLKFEVYAEEQDSSNWNGMGLTTDVYLYYFRAYAYLQIEPDKVISFNPSHTWTNVGQGTGTATLSGTGAPPTYTYQITTGTYSWGYANVRTVEAPYYSVTSTLAIRINRRPTLDGGCVTPTLGNSNTQFTYWVKYTDPDGDAPAYVKVVVDGTTEYTMSYYNGSYTTGAWYRYILSGLPTGTHNYSFKCDDGYSGGTRQTSTYSGPTIDNTPPSVTVSYPNGGENVRGTITIQWSASDANGIAGNVVNIYYGPNQDGPWTLIVANTPNDGAYDWNTASVADGQYYIMVNCTDNAGNRGYDVSNNRFRIDNTPPSVTVIYPNGGENVRGTITIQWSATDSGSGVSNVSIYYGPSSTGPWTLIVANTPNDGTENWNTGSVSDGLYYIRINCTDLAGNPAQDTSNNAFRIDNTPPSVTVTYPNGGENVRGTITITWSASDSGSGISGNRVNIYYGTSATGPWTPIVLNTPNDGNENWNTGSVSDGLYYIMINCSDVAGNSGSDTSNNAFRIDNTPPTVTVIYPNGGENLQGTVTIRWSASDSGAGISGNVVNIYYRHYTASEWSFIVTTTNNGSYNWNTQSVSDGWYYLMINCSDAAGNTAYDTSDNAFRINNTGAKLVEVISPNGGENLRGIVTVRWEAFDTLTVSLYYGPTSSGPWTPIAVNTPNDGAENWNTSNVPDGLYYVMVNCTSGGQPRSDTSNSAFRIDNTPPSVTVTYPNGGENVRGVITITWSISEGGSGVTNVN